MCMYCKRLEEVRKRDRIIFDNIRKNLIKELNSDLRLFGQVRNELIATIDNLPVKIKGSKIIQKRRLTKEEYSSLVLTLVCIRDVITDYFFSIEGGDDNA